MRARQGWAVAGATAAVAMVIACGSGGADSDDAADKAAAPVATTTAAEAPATGGLPPKPDAATTEKYIAALKKIDADIVGDKDDSAIVNRGRDQCSSVSEWPDDEAKLIKLTNQRFTSPDHPDGFGEKKSKKILAAVRKYICPTY